MVSASTGKFAARVVDQDAGGPSGSSILIKGRGDLVRLSDIGPGVRGLTSHGLDRGDTGQAVVL